MNNYQDQESIPVPRTRVFVLADGTFVVQWEENRVQVLMDGRYFSYEDEQYGTAITDYELNQLQNKGVVEHYDDELVYLSPMSSTSLQPTARSYYLNTTLHKSRVDNVKEALQEAGLDDRYSVRVQEIFVIIRKHLGMAFTSFDDAERAREILVGQLPDLLGESVVAFVEVNPVQ